MGYLDDLETQRLKHQEDLKLKIFAGTLFLLGVTALFVYLLVCE